MPWFGAMGASALAAEMGTVCVPLAVGTAVGSSCSVAREQCGGRICHCGSVGGSAEGLLPSHGGCEDADCMGAGCGADRRRFTISGSVLEADVPDGVLGVFSDNEPIVGVRARTLPYTQAVGRDVGPAALTKGESLGDRPMLRRCTFPGSIFALPGIATDDDVMIAFGTRTVVRLPLWGAVNAPLDFTVLGEVRLPLYQIVRMEKPVEVCVPIRPGKESLPQEVRLRLKIRATVTPAAIVVPSERYDTGREHRPNVPSAIPGYDTPKAADTRTAAQGI